MPPSCFALSSPFSDIFFLFEYHKRPYYVGYVYILHKFCWKRTNDLITFRNWIQIIELSKESENEKTTVSRFWKACKYITIKIKTKHEQQRVKIQNKMSSSRNCAVRYIDEMCFESESVGNAPKRFVHNPAHKNKTWKRPKIQANTDSLQKNIIDGK